MLWVALGLLLLVVGYLALRARAHARLVSAAHVIEVSRGLERIKAAARERIDSGPPSAPDDPRAFVTREGAIVVYTMRPVEDCFRHHCSVSLRSGYTAHAFGAAFVGIVVRQLGLPWEEMELSVGASTVHHASIDLDPARHAAIIAAPIPTLDEAAAVALHTLAFESRRSSDWKRNV